jgi:hypothetical protein
MPNPVYPVSTVVPDSIVSHGKASPNFNYLYDSEIGNWRPLNPDDFGAGTSSGYRNPHLTGQIVEVNDRASRLVGFLIDSDFNYEPLFIQFCSYHTGVPLLTYPIYAKSSIDQTFSSPVGGFQGILVNITEDKEGLIPWSGINGEGLLTNVYYKY